MPVAGKSTMRHQTLLLQSRRPGAMHSRNANGLVRPLLLLSLVSGHMGTSVCHSSSPVQ